MQERGKSVMKASCWCWPGPASSPMGGSTPSFMETSWTTSPISAGHRGSVLEEWHRTLEGGECGCRYVQESSWMKRKSSGELHKQNLAGNLVFSALQHLFSAFRVERLYRGKRRWGEKINPRVTTDVQCLQRALLEKVINLVPNACHHCAAWGL